ncbi:MULTISPECIES: choice-of-anchor D domain-containing protein [Giesbergeria]|uniref:Choice-of-anchor D domain-containing protein n=1 Tax=Giesbergeria sinuosa TaxID=80883 RepID=A0ABV9Q8C8_9BURK
MPIFLKKALLPFCLGCAFSCAQAVEFTSQITPAHSGDSFIFSLSEDSLVSLTSVLGGQLHGGNAGFGITTTDSTDVVRSTWAHPGQSEGTWPLQAGQYVLQLWNNSNSTGSYTAQLNIAPQAGGDPEPNQSRDTALALSPNSSTTGHLGFYSALTDERHDYHDFYQLYLPTHGALQLTTTADSTLASAFGHTLYRSDGSTIVRDSSALDAGYYYLQVWANNASAYGRYTLHAAFVSSPSTSGLAPSSTQLDFGPLEVGTSLTQTITLNNQAAAPATLSSITASGDFSIQSDCGSILAVGASCSLTVGFTPSATGTHSGIATIVSDVGNTQIALSGTGMVTIQPVAGRIIVQTPVSSAQAVNPVLVFAPTASERHGSYQLYLAALYGGQLYFLTLQNMQWQVVAYAGGEVPAYQAAQGSDLYQERSDGSYSAQTWAFPLGDLSSLHGLQLLVGFGRNAQDMLARGQVLLLLSVP